MSNDKNQKFDLEERTALFGEAIIVFAKSLQTSITFGSLASQLIRSATSIGANYCEADGAESRKDFMHKIGICKKEAKESKHWLRMMATAYPNRVEEIRTLWKEAKELTLIFSAITKK